MLDQPVADISWRDDSRLSDQKGRTQTLTYFIVTVLGFSFWFFMAVPFASHRESYWWLANVHSQGFGHAFGFIVTTYRPLAQAATWLGFLILDPSIFPTSVLRQALLQGLIYAMFVLAWWLIYHAAAERRLVALAALVTGCVFFSSYVHLFHIYGIFYVPILLTLGFLLRFHTTKSLDKREVWFAVVSTLLVFWHPFATALFIGFYFGVYLDSFGQRSRAQHVQAVVILLIGCIAIVTLGLHVQPNKTMPLATRLVGLLTSYQTNEVNLAASLTAFLLTQMVVFSMGLSPKRKFATSFFVSALSVVFVLKSLPLLLLWLCAVLLKLFCLRSWSLFFLTLAAALLPVGGGIGAPIYGLFAIILATYVTPLGWVKAENALSSVATRYVVGGIIAVALLLVLVRAGIQVPIVTSIARPLLAERERTYQLESILAWLHNSEYCGDEIAFVEKADNPIDSVENAIARRNRPPAALEDVQVFWKTVLQCRKGGRQSNNVATATVTFGRPAAAHLRPVFRVEGTYGGDATVWIGDSEK